MTNFDHDYIVYDEFGHVRTLCMCCGTVIAERQFAPVKSVHDQSKVIMAAIGPIKNSSFREVAVELSDGSYTNLKLCKGCENLDIDVEKCMGQIRRAHDESSAFLKLENDPTHKAVKEKFKAMKINGRLSEDKKAKFLKEGR